MKKKMVFFSLLIFSSMIFSMMQRGDFLAWKIFLALIISMACGYVWVKTMAFLKKRSDSKGE